VGGDEAADAGYSWVRAVRQDDAAAGVLAEMERVMPWPALCGLIEPFYPKPGNGRPAVGVERMLRIYFLQQWFDLSDPAVEEAPYYSLEMRRFVGIDLGREPVSDETRCAASATCLRSTIWVGGCSRRCSSTLRRGG
jgi:hypothetical protein